MSVKAIIKNIKYVLGAQIVILILGAIKAIILPAIWAVESFGYWQIYLFYAAYAGIFSLGFNDGIYLIYGKYQYNELPLAKLRGASWLHTVMLFLLSVFAAALIILFEDNTDREFVLICAAGNILLIGWYGVLVHVLQVTNQMKRYSFFSVLDKLLLMIAVAAVIVINDENYKIIIAADMAAKAVSVLGMVFCCKQLWFGKMISFGEAFAELKQNISAGIKLMIANLMGMLIIGIGRIIIEFSGSIKEYAYYAFGISVTNLVLVLITSVSLVLYPAIKRLPKSNYGVYFGKINTLVSVFGFSALLLYFPAYYFVLHVLPEYSPMLLYLNLLFAVIYLQAKMQLLNNTFYKTLREEKAMLKANMFCVVLFAALAFILFTLTKSLYIIPLSTFIAMLLRCFASQIYLQKKLKISMGSRLYFEIVLVAAFVVFTLLLSLIWAALLYTAAFIIYACLQRRNFIFAVGKIVFSASEEL